MGFLRQNRRPASSGFLIILGLAFWTFVMLTSVHESFSDKDGSIEISVVNSSFIPLSNTNANQVKVSVKYTLEDEKMQNQLVNGVMEVFSPNGTLLRTTSIGSGFSLQSNGGELALKTSLSEESLKSVSITIMFTDLSKKIPLSNAITENLKLESDLNTD